MNLNYFVDACAFNTLLIVHIVVYVTLLTHPAPPCMHYSSLEASLVAHDFPLDKVLQLLRVRYHVFVVVQLLISTNNAEVNPRQVDLP